MNWLMGFVWASCLLRATTESYGYSPRRRPRREKGFKTAEIIEAYKQGTRPVELNPIDARLESHLHPNMGHETK
jgi:hypothetical protein